MTFCCGQDRSTRFCPDCGRELQRKRPLTAKQKQVLALYDSGLTLREVAEEMGVTFQAVEQVLQRLHIARTDRRVSKKRKAFCEEIRRLFLTGLSRAEVAGQLGVSREVVKKYVSTIKIPKRSDGRKPTRVKYVDSVWLFRCPRCRDFFPAENFGKARYCKPCACTASGESQKRHRERANAYQREYQRSRKLAQQESVQ